MRTITYDLKQGRETSDGYYRDISRFSDMVLGVASDQPIDDLMDFIEQNGIENKRKREEYLLDFLTIGTLLRVYGAKAVLVSHLPLELIKNISKLRDERRSLRPVLDEIKGYLSTTVLASDPLKDPENVEPELKNLVNLKHYLEATGEFGEECPRLEIRISYLSSLDLDEASQWIRNSLSLAEWFDIRSLNALGKYTDHVEDFFRNGYPDHIFREDVIFCARRRVEYHLNMVAAEIMNRSFRKDFNSRPLKVVLLPTCMSARLRECRAQEVKMGFQCTGCTEGCIVNRITEMGEENGFLAIMAAHNSTVMKDPGDMKDTGIVGVACVLNLLSGGLKARRLGIPAQCILLDSCGCGNHWDIEGIPTVLNVDQLKIKLNVKAGGV